MFRTLWNRVRTSRLRNLADRLPGPLKRVGRSLLWRPGWLQWRLHSHGHSHAASVLKPLQGEYAGCRAIIMGNGPSLRRTNWDLVRREYTFGLNRISLLFEEMGFVPSFCVCVKDLVIEQFHQELDEIDAIKVFDWKSSNGRITPDDQTVLLPRISSPSFHEDISGGWNHGFTVTFAALQLAFYLGFEEVILIGVDHHYSRSGRPRLEEVVEGQDPDHFSPDYFPEGVKWAIPDLAGSETTYRLAQGAYGRAGRSIVDATDGGRLEVFPKATLEQALAGSSAIPRWKHIGQRK